MGKICKIIKKKFLMGNRISHSNKKTKYKFLPNLKKKRIFFKKNSFLKLRLSTKGLKYLNKNKNKFTYIEIKNF